LLPSLRLSLRPSPRPRLRPKTTRRVAVTGGIAAGKSEALRAFERAGAAVCSSDDVVHRLIEEDGEVRAALEQRFGTTDRSRIAEVVFGDAAELDWLETLLHPRVRREIGAWLETLDDSVDVAVVEIPLLYETGGETSFEAVVVITAPEEVRIRRSGSLVEQRSDRLIPDDEKVRRADFAYVNDGSLEELDRFVAGVLEELRLRR
jgi:dephospho-CoA kinase